jgi:hypothetical protein
MDGPLFALGRAIIKLIISLFVGGGVGLLTFGITTNDIPDLWRRDGPPSGFFTALGAGMLSSAFVMMILFLTPRLSLSPKGKGAPFSELPN